MNNLLKFRFKAFALITLLLVSVVSAFAQKQVAIIDAGSSGSRLYVYRIDKDNKLELLFPKNAKEEKNSKGRALSKVFNHKDSVVAFVSDMTSSYTPSSQMPLYVLATAGMRMKGQSFCDSIYSYMSPDTEYGKYKIKGAMTISGKCEGLYAWISANYNKGVLEYSISTPEKPLTYTKPPFGIIEIGGASMQIAFAPKTKMDDKDIVKRKGFTIYSKSYLGGGVDQIYENYKGDYSKVVKPLPTAADVKSISFEGLGKPIQIVLDSVKNKGCFEKYISSLTSDEQDKFHSKSNAQYIQWLFEKLGLIKDNRPTEKIQAYNASWTQGAALDILVNGCEPEAFNYSQPN